MKAKWGKVTRTVTTVYRECTCILDNDGNVVVKCATPELADQVSQALSKLTKLTYTTDTGEDVKEQIGRDVGECFALISGEQPAGESLEEQPEEAPEEAK